MNNIEQSTRPSIPYLRGSEDQMTTLRKRLEDVCTNVSLAHDVVTLCVELSGSSGYFNAEISHVLRHCAADRLHLQMEALIIVIERLDDFTTVGSTQLGMTGRATA